jgi:serine/threonine protein kinase
VERWSFVICNLAGILPFANENFVILFDQIITEKVEMEEKWADDLKSLLERLLMKDPRNRLDAKAGMEYPWLKKDHHLIEVGYHPDLTLLPGDRLGDLVVAQMRLLGFDVHRLLADLNAAR